MATTDVKPRISRAWDPHKGRMIWWCSPLPAGRWGMGISQQAHYDWRKAYQWCALRNLKEAAK